MMNRHFVISIVTVFVLLVASGTVGAQTLYGSTGLFAVPTADVLNTGDLGASLHMVNSGSYVAATYGITSSVEVGVVGTGTGNSQLGPVVKMALYPETAREPGLALGFEDGSLYGVFSKVLRNGIRGHVGFGTGHLNGLFLGADWILNPVSVGSSGRMPLPTKLIVEYDGGINAGVRLGLGRGLRLDLGVRDLKDLIIGGSFQTGF